MYVIFVDNQQGSQGVQKSDQSSQWGTRSAVQWETRFIQKACQIGIGA